VSGVQIFDSTLQPGTTGAYTLPPFLLNSPIAYNWGLYVTDTDGLVATVARGFSTNFTQPPALTGLVLTPDPTNSAIDVSWNQSGLSGAEFLAYYVYMKNTDGQFVQVGTISTETVTSFVLYRAGHNVDTFVRVTQTNGWTGHESQPLEGSAMLGGVNNVDPNYIPGYWTVDLAGTVLPIQFTTAGVGDTQVQIEEFVALGRSDKVLLTWGLTGYEGEVSVFSNDRDLLDALRGYKDSGAPVLWKTYFGAVRCARFVKVQDQDRVAGYFNLTVGYVEVDAAAAGF
jgi:hypothetical protein